MLTARVGRIKMARRQNFRQKVVLSLLVLVPVVIFIAFVLQTDSIPFLAEMRRDLSEGSNRSGQIPEVPSKRSGSSCVMEKTCEEDHFSFFIQSGAANIMAPKICVQNKLALGAIRNNAGNGLNIVLLNGKTGEVIKTGHFDMYNGEVGPLIEMLKSVETGSIVLMTTFDDPSTKLNEEARTLIAELGSSQVKSLGFRDNWVFVGGKGAAVKSNFEKYIKNDNAKNKYDNWPELIEMQGCIPKYLE